MSEPLDFILRFSIFAAVHSLLAIPGVKGALAHRSGLYRLAYNLLSCLLFGWVMLVWQSTSVLYLVPGVWSLVCHGLQGVVLLAVVSCLRQTGMAAFLGTDLGKNEATPRLHTTGWYRLVRHPLYLLGILFCLLNPVMTTRWLVLTLLSTGYFLAGALLEERRLLSVFGFAYEAYRREVPFIIPRVRRSPTAPQSA
ncbi:methyltransferase family protein [Trichlorobacter ammonificans]|uniref:NnrU domain-containing protein n=1 Tax=Trichlorobacter ammonificans TaxID=2916410 RepID=A0ABM9D588_9BACT|nr:methyltransferase [Trichlorobacter ammonificans]CAH2030371.1 NnrU domain-containing protein [Trichlorobacter ammonificans]